MNRAIWLMLVLSLFFSCKENKERRDNTYQYYSIYVTPNSGLVLNPKVNEDSTFRYYDYELTKGKSTIFTLTYAIGDSTYADAGTADIVVFEVDSSVTEFNITDSDFNNHNGLYEKACFCIDEYSNKATRINSGQVIGRKITSNSWLLKASIDMIDFEDTVSINKEKIISLK